MKRALVVLVLVLVTAVIPAPGRAANKYPPGPGGSCPDSVTIERVENAAVPCHPATLDTVLGVRGVITAFDTRPSAYSFYIQNTFASGPKPWTGVDVFTGATNYNAPVPGTPTGGNLALGDSVVVYGTAQEFPNPNGTTEIEGPDAIQSTNDILIRKISISVPLPAPKVGTTHDYNWLPAVSAATAEPWEGCLVRINGPLRVARVAQGLGVQGNNFLIVNPSAPSDSVLIDGFTLFLFGTPPLNTSIDFVQGILNQNTGQSVNSYRIQLRDANDISLAAPPNLVEAYPLENNRLRLLFDKNLDLATAQSAGNYSLGSGVGGSTVDNATLIGGAGTTVELGITSVLAPGDAETITTQNIGTATCPSCLSPTQTLGFAQGVLTIAQIQAPDPASLAPCDDRSRFAGSGSSFGTRLTFRGVATQNYGSLYYVQDPIGGARSGVSVFGPSQPLVTGHRYRIAARVQEFGGETEVANAVSILDEGFASVPPASLQSVHDLDDTTCDATQTRNTGEDWEGTLVWIRQGKVVPFATPPRDPAPGGSFLVVQPPKAPTDTILVSSLGGHYAFDADTGDMLNVTGVLHYENGSFRILPRGDGDIVLNPIARNALDKRQKVEVKVKLGKLCLKWNGDYGEAGRGDGEIYLTVMIHWPTRVEHPESLEVIGPVNGEEEFETSTLVETPPGSGTYVIQPVCHNVDDSKAFVYSNQADCPVATKLLVDVFVWEEDKGSLDAYKKLLDVGKQKVLKDAAAGGLKATLADLVQGAIDELLQSFTGSGDDPIGRFTDFVDIPDPCTNCVKVVKTLDLENRVTQALWNEAKDSHSWEFATKGFPNPPPVIGTVELIVFVCPKTEMFSSHDSLPTPPNYQKLEEIDLGQSDECTITTALGLGATIPPDSTANVTYSAYLDADDNALTGAATYPATGAEYQVRLTVDHGNALPGEFLAYNPGSGTFVAQPAGFHSASLDPTRATVFLSCQRAALGAADSIAVWGVADAGGPLSVMPPEPVKSARVITTSTGYMGIPPAVVALDPPDGAIDVARTTSITIPFDKNMNHVIAEAAVSVTPSVGMTRSWSGNVLKLQPQVPLIAFTRYVVRVDSTAADCVGARDSIVTLDFRTASLPLETTNSAGVARDGFGLSEPVYGVGQGFVPATSYRAYLVVHESVDSLAGRTLHDASHDGPNAITTGPGGTFGPSNLGKIQASGEYNLVVEAAPFDGVFNGGDRIDRAGIGFAVGPPVLAVPVVGIPGPRVLRVGPNPSRAEVTVVFTAGNAKDVSVGIYDVSGRLVRRLGSGSPGAGWREATWDGRDEDGAMVRSGIYFARVRADGVTTTATIVLRK